MPVTLLSFLLIFVSNDQSSLDEKTLKMIVYLQDNNN